MKGRYLTAVAATAGLLWGTSALAVSVDCPAQPSAYGPDYITLTVTGAGQSATCWDYGQAAQAGNPVITNSAAVVYDDPNLDLPIGVSTTDVFGSFLSGTTNGVTSGTFTVTTAFDGTAYLLFKTGSGQNDPWWFAFALTGSYAVGDEIDWALFGDAETPLNALSHAELFGGTPSTGSTTSSGTPVAEPASSALIGLGLGLLGLGFKRRRKNAA